MVGMGVRGRHLRTDGGSENDEALQNEEAAGQRPQNSGGALDTRRWTCPKCKADQAIAVGQAGVRCERCQGYFNLDDQENVVGTEPAGNWKSWHWGWGEGWQ